MLTMQEPPRSAELLTEERPPVEAKIIRDVLGQLGRPDDLHRVQVKPVSGSKYRVNVYVRAEFATYRIAHSYFLEADDDGRVVMSSPSIKRTY